VLLISEQRKHVVHGNPMIVIRQARSCSGNPPISASTSQAIESPRTAALHAGSWQGECSRCKMPQTQADLVRQMLKSLLEKRPSLAKTTEGRSELAIVVAHVLEQTCQVQHWFGSQHTGAEQDLFLALNSAQPEDALPSPLQVDNTCMLANMDLAAAIMPALTPLALLLKVLDSCTLTNLKPQEHSSTLEYCQRLISIPAPELKPDYRMVLLRSAVLATKLFSLI